MLTVAAHDGQGPRESSGTRGSWIGVDISTFLQSQSIRFPPLKPWAYSLLFLSHFAPNPIFFL
jgi:hypothetical protein